MRKGLILVLLLSMSALILGCDSKKSSTNKENMCVLPEISGKTLVEAIVALNGEVEVNPVYVKTNEMLPNLVISYGAGLNPGDEVEKGITIDVKLSQKPDGVVSHDDRVDFISEISVLTGPDSELNGEELLNSGIYGTDLGIPFTVGDKVMFLFGDSFSSPAMKGLWTSNFMALTDDSNFNDGLKIDPIIDDNSDRTIPFAQGKHMGGNETDNQVEVTKIPTGGIEINGYVYVFYMSIRYWGVAGSWNVNYNQVVRSKSDDLKTWEEVEGLRWDEDEAYNFGQIYPFRDEKTGYIYIYGIPGGRNGGCVIGRVTEENFLNKAEYEYQTAKGVWTKGSDGLKKIKNDPYYIVSPSVAEVSVAYNEYLNKYIMVFYRNGKLIMVQSDTADGIFTDSIYLLDQTDYNGIYGGFVHPKFMSDGGKSIYMTVSCWAVYNVYWVKVVLK